MKRILFLPFLFLLLACSQDKGQDAPDTPSFALKRDIADHLVTNNLTEAMRLLDHGVTDYPEDLQLALARGVVLRHTGKPEASHELERTFMRLKEQEPSVVRDFYKVICLRMLEKHGYEQQNALHVICQRYEQSEDTVMQAVGGVMNLVGKEDIEKAFFRTKAWLYLSEEPCLSPARQLRRLCFALSQEAPAAIRKAFSDAGSFRGEVDNLYARRGFAYFRLFRLLQPDYDTTPFGEGICRYSLRDARGARECWKEALRISNQKPDSVQYLLNRSLILLALQGKQAFHDELDRIKSSETYRRQWASQNGTEQGFEDMLQHMRQDLSINALVRTIVGVDEQGRPVGSTSDYYSLP